MVFCFDQKQTGSAFPIKDPEVTSVLTVFFFFNLMSFNMLFERNGIPDIVPRSEQPNENNGAARDERETRLLHPKHFDIPSKTTMGGATEMYTISPLE